MVRNSGLAILLSICCSNLLYANEITELDSISVIGKDSKNNTSTLKLDSSTSTASKLGITIRETPASIEVINSDAMDQRGDTTIIQAVTKTTGIIGGASGHGTVGNYTARGFTGYPGIDFLNDGVKINGTIFSKRTLDVANLDRIEVIRGASSVLNGEGSVGATVNLITKKPSFTKEETEIGFRFGSYDSYRFNFGSAGIITEDKLAYRVDVLTRDMGSNFDGEQRDIDSLSASLLYKIDDDLLASFSLEKSKDDATNDYQGTPLVNGKLDKSVRKINYNNLKDGIDRGENLWIKQGTEWYPTENIEVKNQLYYQNANSDVRRLYLAVQDTTNPNMINRRGYDSSQKQDLLGNRFDFIYEGDIVGLQNKLLVGFDVSRLELDREQSTYAGNMLATSMYNPEKLYFKDFFGGTDDYKKPDVNVRLNQYGVFLEDQLSITDSLKLVGGIRHDTYDTKYDFKQGLSSPVEQTIHKTRNEFSYRAGLVYDLTDTTTLYTSYTSSFESGDASASLFTRNAAQAKLDLTKAEQYEAGVKQSFLDDNAELTASVYQVTKKNMFVNNPTLGAGLLNVGEQTAKGFEVALSMQPIEQLQINANLSYTDSKYDDFVHNGVDYSGKTPSSVPKYVGNLGVRYEPIANFGIGTWIKYVDSFHTDNIGFTNSVELPSYTTADLTLDYTYNKNTSFSFLLKNVTDEVYATTARRDAQVFLGDARSFEFSINYKL